MCNVDTSSSTFQNKCISGWLLIIHQKHYINTCLHNNEKEQRDVHGIFSTEVSFSLNFNLLLKPPIDGLPIGLQSTKTKNLNWKLLSRLHLVRWYYDITMSYYHYLFRKYLEESYFIIRVLMLGGKHNKTFGVQGPESEVFCPDSLFSWISVSKAGTWLTWKAWRTSAICLCNLVWSQCFNTGLKVTSFWTLWLPFSMSVKVFLQLSWQANSSYNERKDMVVLSIAGMKGKEGSRKGGRKRGREAPV